MKKLLSVSYRDWAFNCAMLLIRLTAGALIIPHGYDKLMHFATKKHTFMNFMGLGSNVSLSLVIFAEVFCAALVALGLFTRLAVIPLIITMCVVVFKVNHGGVFGNDSEPVLFLGGFLALLLCGPGRISVDGLINK
jgi:putative oxidoreductase